MQIEEPFSLEEASDAFLSGVLVKALRGGGGAARTDELSLCCHIWLTLQGLLHAVGFDRAALLLLDYDSGELVPGAWIGKEPHALATYRRSITATEGNASVAMSACLERKVVFSGSAISDDGVGACSFPIFASGHLQGVFYGEKTSITSSGPLSLDTKMRVVAFAECWQEGGKNSKPI